MVSMNIAIKQDAYNFLSSLKSKDESFSDVILEFKDRGFAKKGSKEAILKFSGVLKDKGVDWGAKEQGMKSFRESFNKRLVHQK